MHLAPHRATRVAASRLLRAALPCSCALCGTANADALCQGCRLQFFGAPRSRCSRCAIALPALHLNTLCGACLQHVPAFDAAIAAVDYAPPIDQLVLALKFGSRLALAPLFAELVHCAAAGMPAADRPSVLTAMPLGAQRLRERGFNQALEIAKPLARALRIRLDPCLVCRIRETQPQSMLHPKERRDNVKHAFAVPAAAASRIRGAHVGIVDDVMTTGETLEELAATLKRFGAARITALVFARTPAK